MVKDKLFIICVLLFFLQNFYAQNDTLTLKIPNAKKKDIGFPPCITGIYIGDFIDCMLFMKNGYRLTSGAYIGDCIDSTYKQNDTLFIVLRDSMAFFETRSGLDAVGLAGYVTGLRKLTMPMQDDFRCDFIILKTEGLACSFGKVKRKNNTYKLFAIREEDIDYSNKKIMDWKELKDIYGIEIRY
jgi:hypothetical protein